MKQQLILWNYIFLVFHRWPRPGAGLRMFVYYRIRAGSLGHTCNNVLTKAACAIELS